MVFMHPSPAHPEMPAVYLLRPKVPPQLWFAAILTWLDLAMRPDLVLVEHRVINLISMLKDPGVPRDSLTRLTSMILELHLLPYFCCATGGYLLLLLHVGYDDVPNQHR